MLLILRNNVEHTKQNALIDYLVKHNFNIPVNIARTHNNSVFNRSFKILLKTFIPHANVDLQKVISGMTAVQIVEAMEIAKDIQSNLMSTSLGRELS